MHYIALIHKEQDSDYGVSFPDFPGCVTAGTTLEQAKDLAQEAIIGHIALLKEMGEKIPAPSSLEEILALPEHRNAIAFLVEIPSQKTMRINITLPDDVLSVIDRRAKRLHLSRSAFIASAALNYGKSSVRP
ncbi:MAG: type II toxin-antitoxin system HicB family antitoxin [Chlamydiia bacterium]|nr:type II toxin-antitoxin system HicB family antitoxin [Chlamydiia bacterium]